MLTDAEIENLRRRSEKEGGLSPLDCDELFQHIAAQPKAPSPREYKGTCPECGELILTAAPSIKCPGCGVLVQLTQPSPSPTPGEVAEAAMRKLEDMAFSRGFGECAFCGRKEPRYEAHGPNCPLATLRAALSRGGGRWTRDKPTEPGWHWFKTTVRWPLFSIPPGPDVYRLFHLQDGTLMVEGFTPVQRFVPGEWCGPIPPPAAGPSNET